MSGTSSHQVSINCEAVGYPDHGQACAAVVEIDFGEVGADHVRACTRLRIGCQAFACWRMYYGFDILTFTDGVARLHERMQGSARLNDWDGEAVLCLTAIDRRRGRIAIGGQLIPAVFWTGTASEAGFLAPRLYGNAGGIRIAFEGLVTDQSYLPHVIAGLRHFLSDTRISVQAP